MIPLLQTQEKARLVYDETVSFVELEDAKKHSLGHSHSPLGWQWH